MERTEIVSLFKNTSADGTELFFATAKREG